MERYITIWNVIAPESLHIWIHQKPVARIGKRRHLYRWQNRCPNDSGFRILIRSGRSTAAGDRDLPAKEQTDSLAASSAVVTPLENQPANPGHSLAAYIFRSGVRSRPCQIAACRGAESTRLDIHPRMTEHPDARF